MMRRSRRQPPPALLRLLAVHAAVGALVGCLAAATLLTVGDLPLGRLLASTEAPAVAALLLFGGFALTFASLAMGAGIMLAGRDE